MQYTREPRCFTSRPAFSQLVKNIVSSSFPILRLQLIKNAGQGSPSVPSSKWYHSGILINQFLLFVDLQEKPKKKNYYNTFALLILSEMAYLAIFWLVRFEENRKRFDQVWILFYIYKQPTYKIGLFLMKRRIKLKNWKKKLNPIGTVHYWKKIILHIASSVHDIQILPEDNNWTTTLH